MKTIGELISVSIAFLQEKGLLQPRREVEELLAFVLKLKRIDLYLQYDRPVEEEEVERFREHIRRKAKKEPFEYILGQTSFYDCTIRVNPSVLIPRPETEILVDLIVKKLKEKDLSKKVFWDLCSGSGCIGIAIKKALPALHVILSDISPDALELAAENARLNEVYVELREGDLLTPFQGELADYIVCNPPYISEKEYETLDSSVARFEPKLALIGGKTGLEYYQRLAENLARFLKKGSEAFFEIGRGQGNALKQIFSMQSWAQFCVKQDWSGLDRFFFLEKQ
ncbi:MAG: peptide chain release factor N(5)-glutamine methyltransferase [Chlamydiae bacterium]|nr:peptide chain release factor N(5)-glutamine methyltransferase [Chlamydiota bacterium]